MALDLDAERVEIAQVQYYGWALKNRAAFIPTPEQLDHATEIVEKARVDLKGKLEKIESLNDILSSQDNTLKNEALSALVVLGIERKKANKAIDEILSNEDVASVEELIKKTLKAV